MIWILGYVTLLLAVGFGKLSEESNKCVPVSDHNFCYFEPSPLTWTLAYQLCELYNSTLPTITNEEEQEALTDYLNSTGITSMLWTTGKYVPGNGWKWIRGAKFRETDLEIDFSRWSASAPRVYNDSTDYCISVIGSTGTWTAIDCNTNSNFICQYNGGPSTANSSGSDQNRVTSSGAKSSNTTTSGINPSRSKTAKATPKTSTTGISGIGTSRTKTSKGKTRTTRASSIASSRVTASNTKTSTTRVSDGGDLTTVTALNKSDFVKILSYLAIAIVVIAVFIVIVVVTTKNLRKVSARNMRSNKSSTFDTHESSTREEPPLPTDGAPGVGSDANPSTVYAEIPLTTIPDDNGFSNESHICYAPLEFHSETPTYATPFKINKNTILPNSKPTADLYAEVSPQGPTKVDM